MDRNRVTWVGRLALAAITASLFAACNSAGPTSTDPTAYVRSPHSPTSAMGTSGKPIRSPLPNAPFTVAAGQACTFPLVGTIIASDEVTNTFPPEPNGDVVEHISGRLVLGLTNGNTNQSIQVNISGPGTEVFHTDGSVTVTTEGRSLFIFGPTSIPAGPSTIIYEGRAVEDITPSGQVILVSPGGNAQDVCAALS